MASWGGIPLARQNGSQPSRSLEPSGPVVGVGRESCGASCPQAARSQGCRIPARSSKALDPGALRAACAASVVPDPRLGSLSHYTSLRFTQRGRAANGPPVLLSAPTHPMPTLESQPLSAAPSGLPSTSTQVLTLYPA